MDRRRLTMKPIQNKKARKATFERRTKGLIKKASELSTLCGINVCLIVYPPQSEQGEPETWPKDHREVIRSIEKYNDKKSQKKPRKAYDLQEFFTDRKTQIQSETSRVREQRLRMSCPTWDESFDNLGEEKLRMLIGSLDSKIEECNQRIEFIKMKKAKESEVLPVNVMPMNSGMGLMQNMSQDNLFTHPMMPLADSNPLQSHMLQFDGYDPCFSLWCDDIGVQSIMQPYDECNYYPVLENIASEDLMHDEAVFQNGFTNGYYDSFHA